MPATAANIPHRLKFNKGRLMSSLHLGVDAIASAVGLARGPHILVACMPKSGSTYLTNVIGNYHGFRRAGLVPVYDAREQELCQVRLSRYNRSRYVAQQHVRNSAWTQAMIAAYRLTPVVLVRNVFDAVISLRDHVRNESGEAPMAHFTSTHLHMDDADLEEAMVRLAMPWYMNFYAGWRQDPNALFIHYEDLVADPEGTIATILTKSGVTPDAEKIRAAIDKTKGNRNRLNVGVTGRGQDMSPRARQLLEDLIALYPEYAGERVFAG